MLKSVRLSVRVCRYCSCNNDASIAFARGHRCSSWYSVQRSC